jgi:hypothetical protein
MDTSLNLSAASLGLVSPINGLNALQQAAQRIRVGDSPISAMSDSAAISPQGEAQLSDPSAAMQVDGAMGATMGGGSW